jgi:hypothetical protein
MTATLTTPAQPLVRRAPVGRLVPVAVQGEDRATATGARLWLAVAGVLPVSLIGLSAFGIWDLRVLALALLVPAIVVTTFVAQRTNGARRALATGARRGIGSTLAYDLFRWTFLWFGWMQTDPIPHIGTALGLSPAWVVGYAWRYFGNGGGLALAFTALGGRGVRVGMVYGLAVCAGLLAVLVVTPFGQQMLFPLNATTVVMAVGGHLIYGGVLGGLAARADKRR